jgi:hypothetical protein
VVTILSTGSRQARSLLERAIEWGLVDELGDGRLASDRAVRYTGFLKVKMLLMEVSDVN